MNPHDVAGNSEPLVQGSEERPSDIDDRETLIRASVDRYSTDDGKGDDQLSKVKKVKSNATESERVSLKESKSACFDINEKDGREQLIRAIVDRYATDTGEERDRDFSKDKTKISNNARKKEAVSSGESRQMARLDINPTANEAENTLLLSKGSVFLHRPLALSPDPLLTPTTTESRNSGHSRPTEENEIGEQAGSGIEPGAIAVPGIDAASAETSEDGAAQMIGLEEGRHNTSDDQHHPPTEHLFSATLVRDREEDEDREDQGQEIVEAKPALEGFQALIHNPRFKWALSLILVAFLAIVIPAAVVISKQQQQQSDAPPPQNPPQSSVCGSRELKQADYRGQISVTTGGIPCSPWDGPFPPGSRPSGFSARSYPAAGLEGNFCRNPDGFKKAWCYTNYTYNRQECDVPYCDGEEEPTNKNCGTSALRFTDYRGTVNVTMSGFPCQRWDAQQPNSHDHTPEIQPGAGLEENYCRNPESGTRHKPWCYRDYRFKGPNGTMILPPGTWITEFEYCDIPECVSLVNITQEDDPKKEVEYECVNCTALECGTYDLGQADYRGPISVTESGHKCQPWPEEWKEKYPDAGLVDSACRNPDQSLLTGKRAFCHSSNPLRELEYCLVPQCVSEGEVWLWDREQQGRMDTADMDISVSLTCGSMSLLQQDYRGNLSHTQDGLSCQRWDSQEPNRHVNRPIDRPGSGIGAHNYCRNPDGEVGGAWCYTASDTVRWGYCDVPTCEGGANTAETPKSCGSMSLLQQDYRGNISHTHDGLTCQRWDSQEPHGHVNRPNDKTGVGIGGHNYCRNPDGEAGGAWCYTTSDTVRWGYCDVPACEGDIYTQPPKALDCGTMTKKQIDYVGNISYTETGYTCQRWDQQVPNGHSYSPEGRPNANLEENYCRNPDGEPRAWCYVADPDGPRWEFCPVPACPEPVADFEVCGSRANHQEDYIGSANTTATGRACSPWTSFVPPSNGNELQDNFCRNPTSSSRAYCFVDDAGGAGDTLWEYCNVPFCEDLEPGLVPGVHFPLFDSDP